MDGSPEVQEEKNKYNAAKVININFSKSSKSKQEVNGLKNLLLKQRVKLASKHNGGLFSPPANHRHNEQLDMVQRRRFLFSQETQRRPRYA